MFKVVNRMSYQLHLTAKTFCLLVLGNKVVNRMFYQLHLTAKTFCLLALGNLMFNCYVYMLAMATNLFSDFIVHFDILSLLKMVGWKLPPKY